MLFKKNSLKYLNECCWVLHSPSGYYGKKGLGVAEGRRYTAVFVLVCLSPRTRSCWGKFLIVF